MQEFAGSSARNGGREGEESSARNRFDAAPLSAAEQAETHQAARRLHAEFRSILSALPAEHRAASTLSRALGVDRATCQRLVGVLAKPEVSVFTLVELPGVEGLNLVLEAIRKRRWANPEQLATADAAVDRMAELLDALGGSQRKLKARLERIGTGAQAGATGPDARRAGVSRAGGVDDEDARRALHDAALVITGRWAETLIFMRFIRPVPGDPLMTETAIVRGLIGHVTTARAMPLEIGGVMPLRASSQGGPALSSFDARPATGNSPGVLMREFCTGVLPRIVSHTQGVRVSQVIDTPDSGFGAPSDIMLGTRGTRPDEHPATRTPPIGEIWSMVNFPAQAMVIDTYLHRDIARRCIPGLSVHLWTPDVLQPATNRWSTRFPGGPRLHVLAATPDSAATAFYARMPELTARAFDLLKWERDAFVGYRCETTYPVWRAGYCTAFDFTGNELTKA